MGAKLKTKILLKKKNIRKRGSLICIGKVLLIPHLFIMSTLFSRCYIIRR